jgi:superfamily II DNA or RNA helicase
MTIQLRPHQKEAVEAIAQQDKGIFTIPTGGGKTIIGIKEAMRIFNSTEFKTVCVVAPRLALSRQLCSEYLEHITNAQILCVHSGKSIHYNTTKAKDIVEWTEIHKEKHRLIFTTYHSLKKVKESGINVDTYIYDEAHNSVRRDFHEAVQENKEKSRSFFFTATPKNSYVYDKPGMNDVDVYGKNICNVPADYLVDNGFILQPEINTIRYENADNIAERDCSILTDLITENGLQKVMVVAKKTKNIIALFNETDFQEQMKDMGYSVMSITSQYGGYIDGKTYDKDHFFHILNEWGRDESKKFVVFQYSMIGEGINLSCLDSCIIMRRLDNTGILQNIGRCIRLHPRDVEGMKNGSVIPGDLSTYHKPNGRVFIPIFDKVSEAMAESVKSVVDRTFNKGELVFTEIVK